MKRKFNQAKELGSADEEGEIIEEKEVPKLDQDEIKKILKGFKGKQIQTPPIYSAIKVNGKKLYEYAREGKKVEIPKRKIEIYDINLLDVDDENKQIKIIVKCSKGTYIRSLCEDIARKIGTVGYMKELIRLKVGTFDINNSITIEELEKKPKNQEYLDKKIISIEEVFSQKNKIVLNEEKIKLFLNGVKLTKKLEDGIYRIYDNNKKFIGIGLLQNNLLKRDIIIQLYYKNHSHILKTKEYKGVIFLYYIQETDKLNFLFKIFNIVRLEENKIILPVIDEKLTAKKAQKLALKTKKILDKTNCKKVVISKNIKKQEKYINNLYTYNIDIIDGKWLFEILSNKALKYIVNKNKIKAQEEVVSILVNDLSLNMLENIKEIVQEYKGLNIVTNHINKFKKLEKQILDEYGTMITITNNKKKSLSKSKLILNVDFPEELINKYIINENAIIINLKGNVKIHQKRFNGVNINDYDIIIKNQEGLDLGFDYDINNKYKMAEVYESQIYLKQPYKNIMNKISKDKVQILLNY